MISMHAISQFTSDHPAWQTAAERRLRLSMALSTLILAGILSLIKFPVPSQVSPLLELIVVLTRPLPVTRAEAETPPPPAVTEPDQETLQEQAPPQPATTPSQDEPAAPGEPTDWEALREQAIKDVLDAAEKEAAYSVNPRFTAARREAAIRFRASLAPGESHAWDHVEKDQLGRTILRLGDGTCFQILDDPSGVNRWAFKTFDQNTVFCTVTLGRRKGENLPWVELIRERYPYLHNPVEIH